MRYAVILVPDASGHLSAMVPAMPGCYSAGDTQVETLQHIREAIDGWLNSEAAEGRLPPIETSAMVTAGVAQALQIIDDMREAGELPPSHGYELEVTTVEIQPAVPV